MNYCLLPLQYITLAQGPLSRAVILWLLQMSFVAEQIVQPHRLHQLAGVDSIMPSNLSRNGKHLTSTEALHAHPLLAQPTKLLGQKHGLLLLLLLLGYHLCTHAPHAHVMHACHAQGMHASHAMLMKV